jgi:cullin 1
MLRCMETFRTFYDNKTNNNKRKLTWVYSLGNVNIKGLFGNYKKAFDISVTTVQAAVMLMFNSPTSAANSRDEQLQAHGIVSFVYLQEALNMPEDVLKKVLHSLCYGKFKVVKKIQERDARKILGEAEEEKDDKEDKEKEGKGQIKKTDIFQFNDAFK